MARCSYSDTILSLSFFLIQETGRLFVSWTHSTNRNIVSLPHSPFQNSLGRAVDFMAKKAKNNIARDVSNTFLNPLVRQIVTEGEIGRSTHC